MFGQFKLHKTFNQHENEFLALSVPPLGGDDRFGSHRIISVVDQIHKNRHNSPKGRDRELKIFL